MKIKVLLNRARTSILITLLSFSAFGCKKTGSFPVDPPVIVQPVDDYKDPEAYGTPFGKAPDTKDVVIYEVNLRSFSEQANLKGLQQRLDQIKDLGVNVIWLMPVYPVGQIKSAGGLGSPYSVKDYNAINPEFGTLEDLRTVVDEAHKRNMAVILDWVANHTSWDNAWISNKAWYQQDAAGNIISPTGTGWNDVAALNYNNADLRKAMIRAMKYWVLTANIDGYRCDAIDFVPTDFWKQALDTLKKFNDRKLILLGEGSKPEQITAGFQMNYAFDFYNTLKGIFADTKAPSALFTSNANEKLPAGSYRLRYTTNHDVTSSDGSTIDIYKGKRGALAAFVLAACMDGVPLLYNGQEVGCPKKINFFNRDAIDWTTNPDMTLAYQKILAFRASSEAVKTGTLTAYNHPDVIAFSKRAGNEEVLILVNVRNTNIDFSLPAPLQNTNWTDGISGSKTALGTSSALPAYSYLILKKAS
jgi:glycosidase